MQSEKDREEQSVCGEQVDKFRVVGVWRLGQGRGVAGDTASQGHCIAERGAEGFVNREAKEASLQIFLPSLPPSPRLLS